MRVNSKQPYSMATLNEQHNCPNHRMILVSSEMIYAPTDKYQYGQPVGNKVVYRCFGQCKHELEYNFKIKQDEEPS